jgi:preprotein translocase subunit SecF
MSRLGNIGGKLYRGDVSIDFVGKQRLWYTISGTILVVSIVSLLTLGLNLGIEFKGGSVFQFKAPNATTQQVRDAIKSSGVVKQDPIVQRGSAGWRAQTEALQSGDLLKVQTSVAKSFHLGSPDNVSPSTVGASWGSDISKKALQGMIIFIILVVAYLSIAFEWRMAAAAIIALAHDILITIGVYSLVQFEVTPSSVVGLMTILGYSLYDTVVVFDKVRENARGLSPTSKITYSGAANLGVNQSLVRSINTSVIALLPVAGLLFIGAGLLGAGTLKDLALVLFVGMLAGAYSSICIATPILADLKEREPRMRQLREAIQRRESSSKRQAKAAKATVTVDDIDDGDDGDAEDETPVPAARRTVQQGPRNQPKKGTRRERGGS